MKAPTSTCTGINLYKWGNMFFLAPPYHPYFSNLNMFSTICRTTNITMHTNSVLVCSWICLCTLVPLIVSVLDILERNQSPISFYNPHFDDDPCTNSLPAERTHHFFTLILLYLSNFKPFTCSYAWMFIFLTDQNRSMPWQTRGRIDV